MADKPSEEMGKTFTALVRLHEANCKIDYPSEEEQRFRVAVMKQIGRELKLPEVRNFTIDGTSRGIPRPNAQTAKEK
jgi:hypothetical protein